MTHSREDVISERLFVRLLEATRTLKEPFDFEAKLSLHLAGRMGMRVGEIAHFSAEWINWHDRTVEIPEYDPCTKGTDGGVCGYCRSRAEERISANNLTQIEAKEEIQQEYGTAMDNETLQAMAEKRCVETNMEFEEAVAERWEPKTPNSVRSIPFDFNVRTELTIEEFADSYRVYPKSLCTINRRIKRASEKAGISDRVYPHALRATSASMMASRDVSPYSLMSIMGWRDIQTARSYIQASDETAAKEIRSKHR